MNLITDIIRNAEADLSRQLGIEVKLLISDIKITIQPIENDMYNKYCELWKVCNEIATNAICENPVKEISINSDARKVYIFLASRLFNKVSKVKMMAVIGKERSTYYNTIKTANNLFDTKHEMFMNLLIKVNQQLKRNGHESIEI